MLPDPAAAIVREASAANGEALLLDARRGRALLSDPGKLLEVCRALRRGGFSRALDYTAMQVVGAGLDRPVTAQQTSDAEAGGSRPAPTFAFFLTLRAPAYANSALVLKWKWKLDGQPHPSLGAIWPSCGLAEREIFEMLGVPFAGNDNLKPLLLDARFGGFPLRRGFNAPPAHDYGAALLQDRHEDALVFGLRQASDSVGAGLDQTGAARQASDTETGGSRPAPTSSEEASK
jgi:NADH:ubiquinone oxidoreductase subunit C